MNAHTPGQDDVSEGPTQGSHGMMRGGSSAAGDPPREIGPYRLLEELGEGGFGVVYLAERREPMVQRVALKILKAGMDSRNVVARFEQERQALALMDHPNIARVFDAGQTEQGRPYFVMEYVRGEPINAYCDKRRLTIRARLELFSQVCDAVQHAHNKGVIHRDLKPSNILVVEAEDGRGRPVIIDFGVAKAIASRLTDMTLHTEQGVLIGTPEYMRPEQAELKESSIDTRSDVYALGVILYELLTGALPFDPKVLRAQGFWEIHKTIREIDPPRPSTRLDSLGESANQAAQARGIERGELTTTLRNELEWIPLKAMRKSRDERYRSAAELGDDIANYLANRPLIAGPEAAGYKLRKFIKRHRASVAAAGIMAVLLVIGAAGTAWGLVRALDAESSERQARLLADKERAVAIEERNQAALARDRAVRVSQFLQTLLEGAGPVVAGERDTRVLKEVLDAAAARIARGELRDAPAAELDLRLTIGGVYLDLSEFDGAAAMIEPTEALTRPDGQPDDARALIQRARSLNARARLASTAGKLENAEPLARQSLELARMAVASAQSSGESTEMLAAARASTADSLTQLGLIVRSTGQPRDAEPLLREALEARRKAAKGDDLLVVGAMENLANVLNQLDRASEAEPLFRDALAMSRRMYPGDHLYVAGTLGNMGSQLAEAGKFDEALPMLKECLDMTRRLSKGEDMAETLIALRLLARTLENAHREAEAEPLRREQLALCQRLYKGDNTNVAEALDSMGAVLEALERNAEAEPFYREEVAMKQRMRPGDSATVAIAINNLANCLYEQAKLDEARSLAEQAVAMATRVFPPKHPNLELLKQTLADIRAKQQK